MPSSSSHGLQRSTRAPFAHRTHLLSPRPTGCSTMRWLFISSWRDGTGVSCSVAPPLIACPTHGIPRRIHNLIDPKFDFRNFGGTRETLLVVSQFSHHPPMSCEQGCRTKFVPKSRRCQSTPPLVVSCHACHVHAAQEGGPRSPALVPRTVSC